MPVYYWEVSIWEMKLAWNKNKKRPLGIVSKYPNLPFEHKNDQRSNQNDAADDPNANQNDAELNREQHLDPLGAQSEPSDSEEDALKLFNSFQSQGTKLAEVIIKLPQFLFVNLLLKVNYTFSQCVIRFYVANCGPNHPI